MGAYFLKEISRRVVDGNDSDQTIIDIATLYNSLSKDFETDYGRRVLDIYQQKLWIDNPIKRQIQQDRGYGD